MSKFGPKPMPINLRFWEKVNQDSLLTGCWEWGLMRNAGGYGVFSETRNKNIFAHRKAWELTNGEIPDGLCVLHRCDNRSCVNPAHLFLGTHQQNSDDMVSKNRQARGDSNGRTKIPDAEIVFVRQRYADGESYAQIARAYNVSKVIIRAICLRLSRKHL